MAKLVLLSEGLTGKTYDLKLDQTTVGRVADNTIEIADPSVSSHHCEIQLRGGEVVIKDLGSTNGTFINGERVTEGTLKPGQVLRLGMIEMRLETPESQSKPKAKETLDHTRVIPQGVKPEEFGAKPQNLEENTGFEKKSNRATKVFVALAVVVGVVLVAVLFLVVANR